MSHYSAAQLPSHLGLAPWREILPETPPSYPRLEHSSTADITIIGAGFAGLAAAQRLSQLDPTLRVTVLDAGKIAEGASGTATRLMSRRLPGPIASVTLS